MTCCVMCSLRTCSTLIVTCCTAYHSHRTNHPPHTRYGAVSPVTASIRSASAALSPRHGAALAGSAEEAAGPVHLMDHPAGLVAVEAARVMWILARRRGHRAALVRGGGAQVLVQLMQSEGEWWCSWCSPMPSFLVHTRTHTAVDTHNAGEMPLRCARGQGSHCRSCSTWTAGRG